MRDILMLDSKKKQNKIMRLKTDDEIDRPIFPPKPTTGEREKGVHVSRTVVRGNDAQERIKLSFIFYRIGHSKIL